MKEYRIWKGMKARCYAPSQKDIGSYQRLNIQVCDRWKNSFTNFLSDMGKIPSQKYSIERIDNTKNYNPSNCIWTLQVNQPKNRLSNLYFTYQGKTLILKDWSRVLNLSYSALHKRIRYRKMTFEQAIAFHEPTFKFKRQVGSLKSIVDQFSVVPYQNVVDRRHRGWTLKEALLTPKKI